MLTVACVWVRANVPYSAEYVLNLRGMVQRHLQRPHDFVCLTDRPEQLPSDLRTIHIKHDAHVFGWWAKMQLFNPAHEMGGRVLYLDLDSLVVSDLAPVVDFAATLAFVPDGGSFKPRTAHRVVKLFNSSVMVFDRSQVMVDGYRAYAANATAIQGMFWGDQDYLAIAHPWAPTMPAGWFPRLSALNGRQPDAVAKVVLCKKPKNAVAAEMLPWVRKAWRAA
jgi:hypothetical protein